jgi:hypothetical protein
MRGVEIPPTLIPYALEKYRAEHRTPKCCEPRDLIERMLERCRARKKSLALSERGLDAVWTRYFGTNGHQTHAVADYQRSDHPDDTEDSENSEEHDQPLSA